MEIRSGEQNRKEYGVSNVNTAEKKKIWEGLNNFLK
jgi:hypothetical protein